MTIALLIKESLNYLGDESKGSVDDLETPLVFENIPGGNVIPFPRPIKGDCPPEIWAQWNKVAWMAPTKERADLMIKIMLETTDYIRKR